jgi:DNA-directed RNA polymerase subunit RPC12/RpoP
MCHVCKREADILYTCMSCGKPFCPGCGDLDEQICDGCSAEDAYIFNDGVRVGMQMESGEPVCRCTKCGRIIEFCTRDNPCPSCGSSLFTVEYLSKEKRPGDVKEVE